VIVLRDNYPAQYRNSVFYIALDCDCCYVAGLGECSGVMLFTPFPCYRVTWPQHPEYHDRYLAITPIGILWLDE
jgi:hypothetical protein